MSQQAGSPVLSLPPEATTDVLAAVGRSIESPRNLSQTPVILADASVRRFLRKLVDLQYPEAVVRRAAWFHGSILLLGFGLLAVGFSLGATPGGEGVLSALRLVLLGRVTG